MLPIIHIDGAMWIIKISDAQFWEVQRCVNLVDLKELKKNNQIEYFVLFIATIGADTDENEPN